MFGILIGITSSAIGLRICTIAAEIKKLIIKKKEKKDDKIVLLATAKLNTIEVLISKTLIHSNISDDQFVFINNMLKEYGNMKEETKNLKA